MLAYSYTQNNDTGSYDETYTFSQISTDTDYILLLTDPIFPSSVSVEFDITATLSIAKQCATIVSDGTELTATANSSMRFSFIFICYLILYFVIFTNCLFLVYLVYIPITPQVTRSPLITIIIILIITIVLILLVSLSVTTALVIIIVVLYRKTQQQTHTTTPTAATHPYEYIDMDKVAAHLSPARTADDTDYIHMTNPQYSNLK